MGATKRHVEENVPVNTSTGRSSGAARQSAAAMHTARKKAYAPGRYIDAVDTRIPWTVLVRQLRRRVYRAWQSVRFQFNYHTRGIFQHTGLVKGCVLLVVGYWALFSEVGLVANVKTSHAVGRAKETSMSFEGVGKMPTNDAAPVGAGQLTAEMANNYIDAYSDIAVAEMHKYGVPASIALAQGLVESRAGSSRLARRNNNHFGMKCFSKKCPKGHCSNFTDDHHKDFFRIYKNPEDSWRAHSLMISTGRYARLKRFGNDYRQWAYGLKSLGYATDRTYAEKLIGMIERFDLHRFD